MPPKKRAHSRHTNTQRPSKRTRSSDLSEVPPEAVIAPQHHRTSQNLISVDLQALSASIAATVSQAVQDALGTAGARNNTQDPGPSTLLIPDSSPSAAPPMDPVEEEIAVISGPDAHVTPLITCVETLYIKQTRFTWLTQWLTFLSLSSLHLQSLNRISLHFNAFSRLVIASYQHVLCE